MWEKEPLGYSKFLISPAWKSIDESLKISGNFFLNSAGFLERTSALAFKFNFLLAQIKLLRIQVPKKPVAPVKKSF